MNTKPIFLVEDNPDDELLVMRSLQKNNISNPVLIARDGAEALDRLFATGPHAGEDPLSPALILLDLKLPKVDGLEVLQKIRSDERTRLFPVVVLTSSDEEADLLQSYQRGVNSYVRKPVDFSAFSEAIVQVGERREWTRGQRPTQPIRIEVHGERQPRFEGSNSGVDRCLGITGRAQLDIQIVERALGIECHRLAVDRRAGHPPP